MKQGIGNKQSGAALILMAFMLGLAVTAYLLKSMNAASLAQQQDEKTYKALADAKAALIAWAVSHPNLPGLMPYPDRLESNNPNYDGSSDCYAAGISFNPRFVLGRLPLFKNDPNCLRNNKLTVKNGLSGDFRDGTGERLWYEVSSNLVYDYKGAGTAPIINPGIVNNPANAWMTVRDRNGVVLSNRVAAVIISPGPPIGPQDRSGGIAAANQYLDKVVMADDKTYENYGYAEPLNNKPVQEFIIGDDYKTVSKNDPTYKNQSVEPYFFNDKLVYITIDELMYALEKRVGEQGKASLNAYFSANGYYPNAAYLNAGAGKRYCVGNKLDGALPMDIAPASYSCRYIKTSTDSKTTCSFDNISSVAFTRATGSFTSSLAGGSCAISSSVASSSDARVCTCTGAGYCSNGAAKFECSANGDCTATDMADDGAYDGTYTISGGVFSSATWPCVLDDASVISCASANSFDVNFKYDQCTDAALDNGIFPLWFKSNLWQDYIYYRMTRPADSNALSGGKAKAAAIIVTVGPAIIATPFANSKGAAQVRPSANINDYLDSVENTNGDTTFEASNKIKSKNYNDQIFLLKP